MKQDTTLVRAASPMDIKGQMVTVVCGTRDVTERLAGHTVAQARVEFAKILQIPSGAVAVLAGQRVAQAQEGQTLVLVGTLEFVKETGVKG